MRKSLIVLLLAAVLVQVKAAELTVGFGEIDYQATEGTGGRSFVVQKVGENVGDLVLTITTLRYDEVNSSLTPDEITVLPDPAEFDPNGRQDFERIVEQITFPPDESNAEMQVFVQFKNDEINEETEGFWVMVRVDEANSDPQDLANLVYVRNGLALAIINDDDEIRFTFQQAEYTTSEDAGVQDSLITVCKQDNITTERTLVVLANLNTLSGTGAATRGEDFQLENSLLTFTVPPEQQKFNIPFEVKQDDIAEEQERFNLFLSVPVNGNWLLGDIQSTNVLVDDDDEAVIGFEMTEYTVSEGDGTVEVCVRLFSPSTIDMIISATVNNADGTAMVVEDYERVQQLLFIQNSRQRECYEVSIVNDNTTEADEYFFLNIIRDPLFTPPNVRIEPNSTRIVVIDDDAIVTMTPPVSTCDMCDENADCVSGIEGEDTCVCRLGYTGDGFTCEDIDECDLDTDGCSDLAECMNTNGSFVCVCNIGYTGDGFICEDIDECDLELDNCDENAECINTPGSFTCQCNVGYTGDGFTCDDIDECDLELDNCDENAECINTPGSFTCQCNVGYTGDGFTCDDIDECDLELDNCDENAECINTNGSFLCQCNDGYTGDGITCEPEDIDECALGLDNCDENARCIDTPGSFECVCNRGYTGDGITCEDIDECELERDRCHVYADCMNIPGSYRCQCRQGFKGNGIICRDINECFKQLDDCSKDAWCTNTIGSFECTCKEGFTGDGVTCTRIKPMCDEEPIDDTTRTTRTTRTHTHGHSHSHRHRTHDHSHHTHDHTHHTHGHTHSHSRSRNDNPQNNELQCGEPEVGEEEETTGTRSTTGRTSRTHTHRSHTRSPSSRDTNGQQADEEEDTTTRGRTRSRSPPSTRPSPRAQPGGNVQQAEEEDDTTSSRRASRSRGGKKSPRRRGSRPSAADEAGDESTETRSESSRHSRKSKGKKRKGREVETIWG